MAKPKSAAKAVSDLSEELDQAAQIEGICKALSVIAPELGEALSVAFSGPLGPLLALGMALKDFAQAASGALADYNNELDQEAAESYQPHLDAVKALQDAWDEAAKRMAEYRSKLAHAGEDTDPIGSKYEQKKEISHAQFDADRKIAESEGQVAEAKVREADAKKGMSPEAIESDIAKARSETRRKLNALTDQENAGDISLMRQEQADRANSGKSDANNVDATEKKVTSTTAQFNADEADRKRLIDAGWNHPLNELELAKLRKEHPDDERAQLADAQEQLEREQKAPAITIRRSNRDSIDDDGDLKEQRVAAAQAALEKAQKDVDIKQKWFDQLNKKLPEREQKVTGAEADADRAKQISLQDETRKNQLPAEIEQKQAVGNEQLRGDRVSEANLSTAAQINAKMAASSVTTGKNLDNTQIATIAALYELLSRADQNSEAMLQLIQTGIHKHESTEQVIRDVQQQMRYLQTTGIH